MTLSGCSIEINWFSSSSNEGTSTSSTTSSEDSSETSSSEEPSSSSSYSDGETQELVKTDIKQTYTDYTANNVYAIDSCPTMGKAKVLVIPIWFTDSSTYVKNKENVLKDIETCYFGSNEEAGWRSVKTYYEEESNGLLSLDGKVTSWYEVGKKSTTYGDDYDATISLAKKASDWYFSNNPSDSRTNYDSDGDGYLDAVVMIYAAPDYIALGKQAYNNLWSYCFWYQDPSVNSKTNPGVNTYFWASYDFMYDQSTAYSRAGTSYSYGDCSHANVDAHTFIHEFGHVLGLDDYYDYGSNSYSPAGGFSMQDYNVGGHDPFSVMAFGWADPYIPTDSCTITINAFQDSKDLILLSNGWNDYDSPFDEYLLLELYTPTGLNELDATYQYTSGYPNGASKTGIRLWHIDARLLYADSYYNVSINNIGSDTNGSRYGVMQAFTNTYGDTNYGSPLGSSYDNYDLLRLVRNSKTAKIKTTNVLSNNDLFYEGDTFDLSTYSSQFPKSSKMNNGKALGFTFEVSDITTSGGSTSATITITKQ